jgi:acylphosphatase
MNEPRSVRHIVVHGKVQGVGFRDFVDQHARQRNLSGWVRNRRDGTVEAVFAGPQKTVEGMIGICRVGPPAGKAERVDQRDATDDELNVRAASEGFTVLPTI